MSGVIEGMRRTLLSCTSIVRVGIASLAASFASNPAIARERSLIDSTVAVLADVNRQELAALTVAAAVLGFSVVAAILLMRTRVRASDVEARLLLENQALQAESDRFRALLFAEPQILISWHAGDDRPDISGDLSLLLPHGSRVGRVA